MIFQIYMVSAFCPLRLRHFPHCFHHNFSFKDQSFFGRDANAGFLEAEVQEKRCEARIHGSAVWSLDLPPYLCLFVFFLNIFVFFSAIWGFCRTVELYTCLGIERLRTLDSLAGNVPCEAFEDCQHDKIETKSNHMQWRRCVWSSCALCRAPQEHGAWDCHTNDMISAGASKRGKIRMFCTRQFGFQAITVWHVWLFGV